MYGLYQSLRGKIELTDAYNLDVTLRKLKKETALRIYPSQAKWIGYDNKYSCNIYSIKLNVNKKLEWTE